MEDASATIDPPVDALTGSRPLPSERLAVLTTSAAFFMIILDTSIVNLALPSIGAELASTLVGLQWIVDGYALVFASLLLSGGSIADRYGVKNVFMTGLAIFTLASALCSTAPTIGLLHAARVLQGAGAALMLPTSLAMLNHAIAEPKRRTQAISTWAGAGALGIALGPVLGGILVEALGWRSIFAVNLPIGLAGLWMTWRHLPESPPSILRSLDPVGQGFAITALASLTAALINVPHAGSSAAAPLAGALAFLVAAAGFLLTESIVRNPMLPLGLFRHPAFSATAAAGLLHNVGIYGMIFVLSIGLQSLHAADPLTAGLLFLPLTGGLAAGTRIGSRVLRSYGPQWLLVGGHLVAALGALVLALFDLSTLRWELMVPLIVIGLGAGTTTPAMSLSILDAVDRSRSGLASGLLNGARQCGGVIGVALLGALLGEPPTYAGAQLAFLAAFVALALASIVAFSAWSWIGK